MRINYTLPTSALTGGIRVLFEIASNLLARGHEVSLTLPSPNEGSFTFDGRILYRESAGLDKIVRFGLEKVLSREELTEIDLIRLERSMPDCDINVATLCTTVSPVYRSGKGKPFYHMQHYETLIFDSQRMRRIAEESYHLPVFRIANSTWLRNLIAEKTGSTPPLVCPAIDHRTFYPRELKEERNGNKLRVVSFGKEVSWKGVPDLLEAMERVMAVRNDIDLVLFGSAPISHRRQNVPFRFLLNLKDDELAELYSSADVVVCPSWYESFPLPPIEAMACGAPVVTTRIGTEDYATDEEDALVVPPRDSRAMSDAILRLLNEEPLRERLRKNGPPKAKEFTWDRTVDTIEGIFKEEMK